MNTERRNSGLRRKIKIRVALLSGVIAILIAWCLLPLLFGPSVVPYPWTAAARLAALMADGELFRHMLLTLVRTLAGFGLALIVGSVVGFLSGRYLLLEHALFVPVSVVQGAPPLLWIVPLVLVLGGTGLAPVGVVFFVVLPLVVIGVQEGIRALDPAALEMMKVYAPRLRSLVREIYFPGLAAHFRALILAGLLLGLKSSIIGEWFGAEAGVGRLINAYFYNFDMPSFYAVAVFYLAVTAVLAWLAGKFGKRAFERRTSRIAPAAVPSGGEFVRRRVRSARIELEDVSFAFGKNLVCDRVSFTLGEGRTTVLTGESGVGKTTLARLALGLLKPKAGRVRSPGDARVVFQEDVFLNHRDSFGNIVLAVRAGTRGERTARALAALNAVGLGEHVNRFPDELSGGMKKRLAFARLLAADPDFIVLDEPFNKLHKKARRELWDLFFRLFSGKGIPSLVITHFPEELSRRKGARFFIMQGGKIFPCGSAGQRKDHVSGKTSDRSIG
ncbi:MAG: ATP-binding cassette domain-containing protein [Spirochaetales bacterium]|nr:ATP-binding cassette domain-containing protein [Spirochaetales bacterium]